MRIVLRLTTEAQNQGFIQTGVMPEHYQEVEIPTVELSETARAMICTWHKLIEDTQRAMSFSNRDNLFSYKEPVDRIPYSILEWEMMIEQITRVVEAADQEQEKRRIEEKLEEARKQAMVIEELKKYPSTGWTDRADTSLPYYRGIVEVNDPDLEAAKARRVTCERFKEWKDALKEAAEEASLELWKAENQRLKTEWIEKNGSDFLREATMEGYECKRRYFEERLAMEYPGFKVDWADDLVDHIKKRKCPSEAAFELAKEVSGRVITWSYRDNYGDRVSYECVVIGKLDNDRVMSLLPRQYEETESYIYKIIG